MFEIYITICVYYGIKKSLYDGDFFFLDIFKGGFYYFPFILTYNFLLAICGGLVYLIATGLINSIKTFSGYSIFLFILIIIWASIPYFFLFLTIYTPFIMLIENETLMCSINKSVKFIRENLSSLISHFSPFLFLWVIFFTIFNKYGKIFSLKLFLLAVVSLLEILTVKFVFIVYKGVKNERSF
ncbi:MAG: hypothetical protein NC922_04565 [Candidatus Omnitrophica bacterium]|nr:hypothetical protein [Candidatus Omnitrophota bacterium]